MDDRILIAVIIGAAILLSSLIGTIFKTSVTLAIPLYILYLTVSTYKLLENNSTLSEDDKKKISDNNTVILSLQSLWILILLVINVRSIRRFFGRN